MKIKQTLALSLIAGFVMLGVAQAVAAANTSGNPTNDPANDRIPGQYVVVLRDNVNGDEPDKVANEHGLSMQHKYSAAIKGFAANIPDQKLDKLRHDSRVAFISEDHNVSISAKPDAPGNAGNNAAPAPQPAQIVPSGVNRIAPTVNPNKGTGVGVAVLDTGIDLTHPDLAQNLAPASKTCVARAKNAQDDNGHGTHVAGTIAAAQNAIGVVGVAPEAKLFAVKVMDRNGSGTWSSIICGIDWVTANASAYGIKVANLSLGGGGTSDNNCGNTNNDALHKAICRSAAAGVAYVAAAGNNSGNAQNFVPAAYDDAVITVSALADSDGVGGGVGPATTYGADDTFASFSNFGSPVDLGAPGVNIYSTWNGGVYRTSSGTSMATPHVAGTAALYVKSHPGASWTQVRNGLVSSGEALGNGHTDPSGLHPEAVLLAGGL